ncbi:MAG: hypothetical protein OXF22_06035 [Anaerolineaceae bacterium]|nr:hypothetical protein [Anaerolineaceae bacterium]
MAMSWWRRIQQAVLGGGGSRRDRDGLYFYVQPRNCTRIARLRIHRYNDLSQSDEGDGYFCRKIITVAGCPWQATLELRFDRNRRITEQWIEGGALVTAEDYAAQEAAPSGQP